MKNKFLSGVLCSLVLFQISSLGYNKTNASGICISGYTSLQVPVNMEIPVNAVVYHGEYQNSIGYDSSSELSVKNIEHMKLFFHFKGLAGKQVCYKFENNFTNTGLYRKLWNGAQWNNWHTSHGYITTNVNFYANFTPTVTSVTVPSYINSGNVSSTPFTINGINDTDSGQTLSYEYSWDNTNWIVAGTGSTPASNRNFAFNVDSTLRPQGNNIMYVRVGDGSAYSTTVSSVNITKDTVAPMLSLRTTDSLFNVPNPLFEFTSTEGGTISYSGTCASVALSVNQGNNGIFLNVLPDNIYSNCSLRVTDVAGNISSALSLGTFEIDTVAPVTPTGFIINSSAQFTNNSTVNLDIIHPNESDVFEWCVKEDVNHNSCSWEQSKPNIYQIQN